VNDRLGSRSVEEVASAIRSPDNDRTERLLGMLAAGLRAVDPEEMVADILGRQPDRFGRVTVVAVGKSAAAMARGAARGLDIERVTGVAVCDHVEEVPDGIDLLVTSHPTPDQSSVAAGNLLLDLVAGVEKGCGILFLVSGGGSSLVEIPAEGLTLDELIDSWRLLTRVGAPIEEVNTVRTHLSAIKGGRLAAAAAEPATTIVISDVVGGRVDLVASGPTVTCSTAPRDALNVLSKRGLVDRVSRRVVETLAVRPPPPAVVSQRVILAAGGQTAAEAIAATLDEALVVTTRLRGHAAEAAVWALEATPPGAIGVFSGETTVEVTGSGRGGRNQEAALAAAIAIEGRDVDFVSFGTDGVDGPTDAAGAVVHGSTAEQIRRAAIEPVEALAANDSSTALDAADALIRTGPTGTNVADIWLVDRRRDTRRDLRSR
jgi:hydroxypyruvate reductase